MTESEIASLRASVERLTAEKDKELERSASMASIRSIYCGNPLHGLSDEWKSRAESAEATIARLAKVVRAAQRLFRSSDAIQLGPNDAHAMADIGSGLSSLTAEDRRRVGIEG